MPLGRSYRKIRRFFEKFFLIDDTPFKVAAGAALGIFLGIVPGEGVITTLILASVLRFNRLSATAGVLATNMWTTAVVLPLAAVIGGFLFQVSPSELIQSFDSTYHLGWEFFLSKIILKELVFPIVVGFVIAASAISLVFYFLLYSLLKYRKIKFK